MLWPRRQARVQSQAETKRIEDESKRHEAIFSALNSVAHELKTKREEANASELRKESRETLTIIGLFITVGIALVALAVSLWSSPAAQGYSRRLSES
jgi:ferric-dicitrate binding protein FerR (iron transport regulator)